LRNLLEVLDRPIEVSFLLLQLEYLLLLQNGQFVTLLEKLPDPCHVRVNCSRNGMTTAMFCAL